MQEHKELRLSGRLLADQLAQQTQTMVDSTLETLRIEVPFYRSLPDEAMLGDVTTVIRQNFEIFIDSLRTLRAVDPAVFVPISESARRRAEELVPLADVLHAYHAGARDWWDQISALASDGDIEDLSHAGHCLQLHVQAATGAVIAGYGSVQEKTADAETARLALFAALTSGSGVMAAAERVGLRLPRLYWVIAIDLDRHPDEQSEVIDAVVAERRKVRRVERELAGVGRGRTLSALTGSGGGALVPIVDSEVDAENWGASASYTALTERLENLEKAAGAPTLAAVTVATVADVRGAYEQVRDVLAVARSVGRTAGVVRLDDVAVEYQLTRLSAATPILSALVDSLDGHHGLREMLECYLNLGCDRIAAAEALHVHPNTVAYRLRKIAEFTGLESGSASGLLTLTAAIAASRSARRLNTVQT